jgi:chitin disaccharide deacetylase
MRRLIVNADDFGIHVSVNRGIAAGYNVGIITSTSLMAAGAAFEDAIRVADECPGLGIGVHLTLVGGGQPVLPPQLIPSLLDRQGLFLPSHPAFIARYLIGRINPAEVEMELTAQVEKIIKAGIVPTHFDSHQHLHALPGICAVVVKLAGRFSIRAIRKPAESVWFFGGMLPSPARVAGRSALSLLASWSMRRAKIDALAAPDHFYGMLAGGQLNEAWLQALIEALPEGSSEIMTHPGLDATELTRSYKWGYHWDEELKALISPRVRERIKNGAIRLISFREL